MKITGLLQFNKNNKMKKLILLILIITPLNLKAQQRNFKDIFPWQGDKIIYTEIIKTDDFSKNELYLRARKWVYNTYNSGKDVVQLDDKENGQITGRAMFETVQPNFLLGPISVDVTYHFDIETKDGRYKYEFKDITYFQHVNYLSKEEHLELFSVNFINAKGVIKLMNNIDNKFKDLENLLENSMLQKTQEDW